MRRTLQVKPGLVNLITEVALSYPQLTLINTGQATVYLGDDSTVDPSNGIPLTAGMATTWSSSNALYAAADGSSTLLITDNASNPLAANLPRPNNTWTRGPGGMGPAAWHLTSDGIQLPMSSTAVAAYDFELTCGPTSATITLQLVASIIGTATNLASFNAQYNQTFSWKAILSNVAIPFGGYTLQLYVTNYFMLNTPGTVTLAVPS